MTGSRTRGIALVAVGAAVVVANRALAWTGTWGPNAVSGTALLLAIAAIVLGIRMVRRNPQPDPALRRYRRPLSGAAAYGVAVLLALAVAAAWWLWLGHDTTYQRDPETGIASGPYEAAQVAGCVLTVLLLAIVGAALLPDWWTPVLVTASFTVAWAVQAAATDETGLWLAGAAFVAAGMGAGSSAVAAAIQFMWPSRGTSEDCLTSSPATTPPTPG